MAKAILDIKQWGNNLGIRLPIVVAREVHLHVGQRMRVSVEGAQVVITPIIDSQLTLAQRLASFDPVRHGGEHFCCGVRTAQSDYSGMLKNPVAKHW
jgi:antitoxin MazE